MPHQLFKFFYNLFSSLCTKLGLIILLILPSWWRNFNEMEYWQYSIKPRTQVGTSGSQMRDAGYVRSTVLLLLHIKGAPKDAPCCTSLPFPIPSFYMQENYCWYNIFYRNNKAIWCHLQISEVKYWEFPYKILSGKLMWDKVKMKNTTRPCTILDSKSKSLNCVTLALKEVLTQEEKRNVTWWRTDSMLQEDNVSGWQ